MTDHRKAFIQSAAVHIVSYGDEKLVRLQQENAALRRSRDWQRAENQRLREIIRSLSAKKE